MSETSHNVKTTTEDLDYAELEAENERLRQENRELERRTEDVDVVNAQAAELTIANERLNDEIKQRKEAEQTLLEHKQRLDTILSALLTGVVIVDAETHEIVDLNPFAAEMIGLPEEQIRGRVCHQFICPAEKGKCPISDLGQTVDKSERVLLKQSGEGTPILKTVKKAFWQGREYLVESFVDITESKKAEEHRCHLLEKLENVNKELQDFAYIVSHDLKAPLRGIKTLASWMLSDYADKLDQDGKEQLNLLSNRVDRMHNLIEGILQYSRLGRVKEEQVEVDIYKLVQEVVDLVVPPENIAITIDNQLPTVKCEQTRITQVFQNLLSNAIKYMDKPQGQINIGCVENGDYWKFSIADNGPGIEQKYFEQIFRIFQTLSARDEFESTGVGLTVVKKIVELHGGKIWIESEVGKGTTFLFTIPKQQVGVINEHLQTNSVDRK